MNNNNDVYDKITNALTNINADEEIISNIVYKPDFITNNPKTNDKVLCTIQDELRKCDEFCISVAFITSSGLIQLKNVLKELEENNTRGKILTTNYLYFTEPKALEELQRFNNIELKMYDCENSNGFHTKGYIFREDEKYTIIIGSSNITQSALTTNKEWNTKVISRKEAEYQKQVCDEFDRLWDSEYSYNFDEFIDDYTKEYTKAKRTRDLTNKTINEIESSSKHIKPNEMQKSFITNIKEIMSRGDNKALLVSATGTGKTYASALACKELGFKKILFIAHVEQILRKSKESFQIIFADQNLSFGIISGTSKEFDSDIIFATKQTLSKIDNYLNFEPDYFDCIIIDEAHHIKADGYSFIMDYFKPKLFLGMTASPDRPDGENVYETFDYNLAGDIRLQDALECQLLCPFHYFGISDCIEVVNNYKSTNQLTPEYFNYLTSDERVKHMVQNAEFYGHSGENLKGLIFVSRKDVGLEISEKLNKTTKNYGDICYKTQFICGDDSVIARENAIKKLQEDDRENNDYLDYIITVDVFNEGVDIPDVNQVIMLRRTQSCIVFLQQLGRGLRKCQNKDYVVVLDFIANYDNNYLIPMALTGDRSYNKDNVRRSVAEGTRIIPGASTIEFDRVSKNKIYEALDNAKFSSSQIIKENYINLKNKLNKIPSLMDFEIFGMLDPIRIFQNKNYGSYHNLLEKIEKSYSIRFDDYKKRILAYVSQDFAPGKRVEELELLKIIINEQKDVMSRLISLMNEVYEIDMKNDFNKQRTLINKMNGTFYASTSFSKGYIDLIFIEPNDQQETDYHISDRFKKVLEDINFKNELLEVIDFGIYRYKKYFSNRYENSDLVLYQKYTYNDVCSYLNWKKSIPGQNIGGYFYESETNTLPIFINYHKDDEAIDYHDRFLDNSNIIALSKTADKSVSSKRIQLMKNASDNHTRVDLFIRKNKDDNESKEFYYLGKVNYVNAYQLEDKVEIHWKLDEPVKGELYDYIVNN